MQRKRGSVDDPGNAWSSTGHHITSYTMLVHTQKPQPSKYRCTIVLVQRNQPGKGYFKEIRIHGNKQNELYAFKSGKKYSGG